MVSTNNVRANLCRLCLHTASEETFEVIEVGIKNLLNNLFLFSLSEDIIICGSCSEKIVDLYNFKARCLHVEDEISEVIISKNIFQVHLKDVYIKVKDDKFGTYACKDQKICRFCLNLEIGCFKFLESVDEIIISIKNLIQTYIPEVNLKNTENPVVCEHCYNFLQIFLSFIKNYYCIKQEIKTQTKVVNFQPTQAIKNYMTIEIKEECLENDRFTSDDKFDNCTEKKHEYVDVKIETDIGTNGCDAVPFTNSLIKNEDIDLKSPEAQSIRYFHRLQTKISSNIYNTIDTRDFNPKNLIQKHSDIAYESIPCDTDTEHKEDVDELSHKNVSKQYRCTICGVGTKHKRSLTRHMMKHKDPLEVKWFQCEQCDFKTIRRTSLKIHRLVHGDKLENEIFTCKLCGHKTGYKYSLKTHMLIHKDITEIKMHKCTFCNFETRWSCNLKNHILTHSDPSQTQTYECDICSFKTVRKDRLKMHRFVQHSSQMKTLTCDMCGYTTKWKSNLRKHILKHKKKKMYKCKWCDFETQQAKTLENHKLKHLDSTGKPTYNCELCDFKTEKKYNLKRHNLVHEVPVQLKTLTCDVCGHKTKYKSRLRIHMLSHTKPLEIKTHKCDMCDFETKQGELLKSHITTHLDSSEPQTYKCGLCDFKTKRKCDLKCHTSLHKDPSQVKTFRCGSVSSEPSEGTI